MDEITFEKAMGRLEEIVRTLEEGSLPLEQSLKVFEEGMKLAQFCSGKLDEAQKKVTMLIKESEASIRQVPFGTEDDADG